MYYLFDGLHGPGYIAHQVVEKKRRPPYLLQVVAATTKSSEQRQLTRLMKMLKGLQATMTELQHEQATRQYPQLRDDSVCPLQPTCLRCSPSRHLRKPQEKTSAFKQPRLNVASANRGPQASPIWERDQRTTTELSMTLANLYQAHRRPRRPQYLPDSLTRPHSTRMGYDNTRWQAPWRSWKSQGLPNPSAWPSRNRFVGSPEEAVKKNLAYSQEYPKLSSQPQKAPIVYKTKKRSAVQT